MRIYLDTNIFIAAFERKDELSDRLGSMLASTTVASFVSSELTLSELLVLPLRQDNQHLVSAYNAVFNPGNKWLEIAPVDRRTLTEAAQLRSSRQGLKLPDAIHLATASERNCTDFLTEDSDLLAAGKSAYVRLQFLRPDESTLTTLIEGLRP
ncbi:PIN domain-containing protein [Rhizobium sp. RU36D]|uniref:type II toxin-antitoxin system VapC family toxin n=1 Tax=Rhizobium sp. RU36D TaxID=1907415 RepID=UPI0009D7F2D8|nr:PIN domain-containing protein [Rhizobium sp. RU36D]SMD10095.1 Predicted nucleic acid-binding protein, contains PIN domain [Rhizobium sp. RU36D]